MCSGTVSRLVRDSVKNYLVLRIVAARPRSSVRGVESCYCIFLAPRCCALDFVRGLKYGALLLWIRDLIEVIDA